MNEPQTFPITTLRDIFNLPTISQMETCLRELSEAMIQARTINDTVVAFAKDAGTDIGQAIEWPEVANWIDDGKGEITGRIEGEGMPTITITSKV